ncbi:MAG: hypothetical protein GF364_04285, partial [Candidatus Lokiarchaeota archaeon]|nr:hypothetical protein [Candidatus Lokiarchaeota archaeon]
MSDQENDSINVQTAYGIVQSLKEHGVKYIFGIPDGHTLAFYDGIYRSEGIEHVLVNDERTAAFAADAYARVTGSLGVCDAGAAGSMNFPVALSEANGSGSPVLAIVGTVKSEDILRNVPHDINVADTLLPITKWAKYVTFVQNVPRFLKYGIRHAINNRPGPVVLVFPENVLNARDLPLTEFLPVQGGACSINGCRSAAASDEIERAISMIANSEQPAIYTGGGAVLSGAFGEVQKLSDMLIAPVFSTISGKGIMKTNPTFNNNYFGTVGLFGERPNHLFLKKKADLIIVVGNRLTEDDTAYFEYPPQDLDMIHIDIDAREIGLSYHALGVIGDPKAVLTQIIERLKETFKLRNGEIRKENLDLLRKAHARYRKKDN